MEPKKPKTVQELIDQLQAWNKSYYERHAKKEIKQKEFIQFNTQRCEPYRKQRSFTFMGFTTVLPELLYMGFTVTNDHIERDVDYKMKDAEFDFNLPLN